MFRHVLLLVTREGLKKEIKSVELRLGLLTKYFLFVQKYFLFTSIFRSFSVSKYPYWKCHPPLMENSFFWKLPFIRKVEFSWRMHHEISVMLPIRIVNQLTLDCITNVNLHSSHFLISLLFIHLTTKTIKHQSNLFLGKVPKIK